MNKKRKLTIQMIRFSLEQIAKSNPALIEYAWLKHCMGVSDLVDVVINLIEPIIESPDLLNTKIRKKIIEKLLIKYLNTEIVDVYSQ